MKLEDGQALFRPCVIIPNEELIPKSSEIESKFQLSSKSTIDLTYDESLDYFRDIIRPNSIKPERLFETVYYDTTDYVLNSVDVYLRRRVTSDGKIEYGLKGFTEFKKDLLIRMEDEVIVEEPVLSFAGIFKTERANRCMKDMYLQVFHQSILPMVATCVKRRSFEVVVNKIILEVVFDELRFKEALSFEEEYISNPIFEIEIEYKKGAVRLSEIKDAFGFVEDFINSTNKHDINFRSISTSKGERGFMALREWIKLESAKPST